MLRRAWSRLIRKEWLFLYPCASHHPHSGLHCGVRSWWRAYTLEFIFTANFDRWDYIRNHFVDGFSLPALTVASVAGWRSVVHGHDPCPYFRAIAGSAYPGAPRWREALNLFVSTPSGVSFCGCCPWSPASTVCRIPLAGFTWVVGILVVFAD